MECFINIKGKFVFTHDLVLEMIINFIILFTALLGLFKVTIVGKITILPEEITSSANFTSNSNNNVNSTAININETVFNITLFNETHNFSNDDMLRYSENLTFGLLATAVVIIFLFLLYSIPAIKKMIKKERIYIGKYLFDLPTEDFKNMVIEHLWKPFWENLFKNDKVLNKNLDVKNANDKIINAFYYQKLTIKERKEILKSEFNPVKRLEEIKKKLGSDERDSFKNLKNLDMHSNYNNNTKYKNNILNSFL